MEIRKVAIGSAVQFVSRDPREHANGSNTHAAIVTRVNPDGSVNLRVLFDGPVTGDRSFAKVVNDGNADRFWRWPE